MENLAGHSLSNGALFQTQSANTSAKETGTNLNISGKVVMIYQVKELPHKAYGKLLNSHYLDLNLCGNISYLYSHRETTWLPSVSIA